ncbi:MAG: three-Cys-motif partner protein TcmP [Candidatus Thorarchaeota archaeon]
MDIDDFFKKRMEEHKGARDAYDRAKKAFPECKLYEKEPWTFLKLVVVGYYIDVYSNIAKKNFKKIAYIDFYAGPGVNYIERLKLYMGGSPFISVHSPRTGKKFDELVLFELDPIKAKSLELVISGAQVHCIDCNSREAQSIIRGALGRNRHYLAFIDPEGIVESKWATLANLFRYNGDVIINYPYSAVAREHGKYYGKHSQNIKEKAGKLLTEFFGNQKWENITTDEGRGDQLLELYLKQLRPIFPSFEVIKLGQEKGGYKFHLIIATKKVAARWLIAVRNVKRYISDAKFDELERFAAIYRGEQERLTDYF